MHRVDRVCRQNFPSHPIILEFEEYPMKLKGSRFSMDNTSLFHGHGQKAATGAVQQWPEKQQPRMECAPTPPPECSKPRRDYPGRWLLHQGELSWSAHSGHSNSQSSDPRPFLQEKLNFFPLLQQPQTSRQMCPSGWASHVWSEASPKDYSQ